MAFIDSMDVKKFCKSFEKMFPPSVREKPTCLYSLKLKIKRFHIEYYLFDPIRDVDGMLSVKKQKLLNLLYKHLEPHEAYLEIGTWVGKSLIAAMHGNDPRPSFACDNFSEYERSKGKSVNLQETFKKNLTRYGLERSVTFFNEPFQNILTKERLPIPIGVYFYDAGHDEESQYLAVKLVEPLLADEALVMIDDWRFASDSQSYAKAGTERAIALSSNRWQLLYELPARYNGDRRMWWNGLALFAFQRSRI